MILLSPRTRRRPRGPLRPAAKFATVVVAGALTLSACAGSGSDVTTAPATPQVGLVGMENQGTPVDGGTLRFASYAMVSGLDPLRTQAAGNTGGTEMAAVYDVLMRYDDESRTYEPQLAQSLESNEAGDVWTLELRPDVKFSDGTALDAEAVLWSINRFNNNRGVGSQLWLSSVQSMTATSPKTVEFKLTRPWASFPAMLAAAHGLIVAASSEAGGTFTPIGAGAFVVDRLVPNEELAMTARADYWGGKPHLDAVRFVALKGDEIKLDSLEGGQIDVGFIRNVEPVAQAIEQGYHGYVDTVSLGALGLINNREGRPGADVRVRKAIAHAVDVDAFDQRVNQGKGMPERAIFPDWSRWAGNTEALPYDTAQAAELLKAAKADGYDGAITILAMSEPTSQAQALSLQAMLQSVGFTADIEYANSSSDMVKRRFIDHNYDIAYSAFNLYEAAPFIRLAGALQSDSSNNALGYASPEMDRLLGELQAATSEADEVLVLEKIQHEMNETVPFVTLGAHKQFVAWTDGVGGVVPTLDAVLLLDEAWVG